MSDYNVVKDALELVDPHGHLQTARVALDRLAGFVDDDSDRAIVLTQRERDLIRSALGRWQNDGVADLLRKIGYPRAASRLDEMRSVGVG